jgi:hypothetical protein
MKGQLTQISHLLIKVREIFKSRIECTSEPKFGEGTTCLKGDLYLSIQKKLLRETRQKNGF